MKVYLAGPSAELDRVRAAAEAIEAAGHTITEKWWLRVEEAASHGWATDADVPSDYMEYSAWRNAVGIQDANVVIALAKSSGGFSSGCAGEIGYAIARSEKYDLSTIIIAPHAMARGFIWSFLVDAIFDHIEEALDFLAREGAPFRE